MRDFGEVLGVKSYPGDMSNDEELTEISCLKMKAKNRG